MTCIAGYADGLGHVVIGGDSIASNGYNAQQVRSAKVFTNGPLVIGYTTSFRFGQIAQYHVKPNDGWQTMPPLHYLITDFVPLLRAALKEHGFAMKDKDREEGGTMLVGLRGQLFSVQSDYSVLEVLGGIDACGAGEDIAIGAMWAAVHNGVKRVDQVVANGLEAAGTYSALVRPPYVYQQVAP